MTDPREKNLPKWAQELLREERTNASLRWPTEADPEPLFTVHDTTAPREFTPAPDKIVKIWITAGSAFGHEGLRAVPIWIDHLGYGHRTTDTSSFGSRLYGHYYGTERDASLACHWHMCRSYARNLRNMMDRVEHCHE